MRFNKQILLSLLFIDLCQTGNDLRSQQFLILDEPSTGLHANDVEKLLTLLRKLVCNGNTVIMVEHRWNSSPRQTGSSTWGRKAARVVEQLYLKEHLSGFFTVKHRRPDSI